MNKSRLFALLTKYQDNACSESEQAELEAWYSSLYTDNQPVEPSETFAAEMLAQFRQKLSYQSRMVPVYKRKIFQMVAAAAVIIVIGLFITLNLPKRNSDQVVKTVSPVDISAPHVSKAYITLSNGKRLYLDSAASGSIAMEGDINVTKFTDGRIGYQGEGGKDVKMNTLTVPKGSKTVKLILADGTDMWLDAATTITYPTAFIGKERKVEILTGQAYFEVAHNAAMPFIVKKGAAEVRVLGTHFNISAFDEEDMKVTLLQGSVKVSELASRRSQLIKPGEQTIVTGNLQLVSRGQVDLDEVMAWKNNNFQFEGADINTVMRQLARWYDVHVELKGNIKAHFGGTISRDVNVSKVFEMLQLTGELHYTIDGRNVIITP